MDEIQELTFKEKDTLLQKLFNEYQRAKVKLHCLEMTDFYPEIQYDVVREGRSYYAVNHVESILNSRIDDKEELRKMIQSFEFIISSLRIDSQRIIEHEYMKESEYEWWREYYGKTTYYRLKGKAMDEILFYLNI